MSAPYQLKIEGYAGKPLDNLFWPAEKPNGWLALILPGLRYTGDMPLLFFTRRLLLWRGVDTLNLNPATRSDAYQNSNTDKQLAWLKSDVLAGLKRGLEQKAYQGIVLAGKSIGSLAIAQAVSQAETLLPTAIVWLTPLIALSRGGGCSSRSERTAGALMRGSRFDLHPGSLEPDPGQETTRPGFYRPKRRPHFGGSGE